jgi:hypothetical protein
VQFAVPSRSAGYEPIDSAVSRVLDNVDAHTFAWSEVRFASKKCRVAVELCTGLIPFRSNRRPRLQLQPACRNEAFGVQFAGPSRSAGYEPIDSAFSRVLDNVDAQPHFSPVGSGIRVEKVLGHGRVMSAPRPSGPSMTGWRRQNPIAPGTSFSMHLNTT